MRRRDFLSVIAGATAWPLAARRSSRRCRWSAFLMSRRPRRSAQHVAAFRQGLAESGYVEEKTSRSNTALPTTDQSNASRLAGDLVRRNVNVIFAQLQRRLPWPGTQQPAFLSLR